MSENGDDTSSFKWHHQPEEARQLRRMDSQKKVKATTTESHLSSCFDFSSLGDGVVRVVKEGGRCLVVVLEGWS